MFFHLSNIEFYIISDEITNFEVYTNGSKILGSDCYEHVGLGPITCAVTSYPQAETRWRITNLISDDENCYSFVPNDTCIQHGDQYNCSSTLTPKPDCYGTYECNPRVIIAGKKDYAYACMMVASKFFLCI